MPPPFPRAAHEPEMLDRPAPEGDVAASLRDIERLNAWFGGARVLDRHVEELIAGVPRDRPASILDVGTGGADLPRGLVRQARRRGRLLRAVALDRDGTIVRLARRWSHDEPEIGFVQGDGARLPFRDRSVDVAIASLTLHHLEPGEGEALLAEMLRVSRAGFIVNDLWRSRAAWWMVWIATRVLATSPISKHDGPLSVLRAYSPDEIAEIARRAGVPRLRIVPHRLLQRVIAIGTRA